MGFQVFFYILLFVPFLFFVGYVCWRIFLNRCISYCVREYGTPAGAHSVIGQFSRYVVLETLFTLQYTKIITS